MKKNRIFQVLDWEVKRDDYDNEYLLVEISENKHIAETTIVIPLEKFETATFFDYRKGQAFQPEVQVGERLRSARDTYVRDLENVAKSYRDYLEKKEIPEDAVVRDALRWNLTDWAKRAKLSELFR